MVTCSVYGCERRASHEVVIRTPLMPAPGFYPTCAEHVASLRDGDPDVVLVRAYSQA